MTEIPQYWEVRATQIMRDLPRFGHTTTFALVTGSKEQRQDYLYGLLFAGVFVIAFFLAVTVLVAVFKALGQKKVGFLSGQPFKVPKGSKRPRRVRSTFIISAIILVIFAILLVTKGLTQLKTGVVDVYDSAVTWNRLVAEAQKLVTALIDVVETTLASSQERFVTDLSDGICTNGSLEEETGINFTALAQNVSNALGPLLQTNLTDFDESMQELEDISDNMAETTDEITLGSWQSLIFIIPFPVFCSFLVGGVILAWFNRSCKCFTCFLSWGVLPFFFILIIVCYFLCGAIAIAASANADFCSGGMDTTPQGTILEILLLNGHSTEETTFRIIEFYLTTCLETGGGPLPVLDDFENQMEPVLSSLSAMDQAISNVTAEQFTAACGGGSYAALKALVLSTEVTVAELSTITLQALDLISCETILPIFTSAMWNGACEYSVQGVTWSFASFLVIAMMGMLMITFRSSWLPTEYVDDTDKLNAAPIDCEEGQEVEYVPSAQSPEKAPQDGQIEVEEGTGGEGAVVVAAGVAAGATVSGVAISDDDDGEIDKQNDTKQDTADKVAEETGTVATDESPNNSG